LLGERELKHLEPVPQNILEGHLCKLQQRILRNSSISFLGFLPCANTYLMTPLEFTKLLSQKSVIRIVFFLLYMHMNKIRPCGIRWSMSCATYLKAAVYQYVDNLSLLNIL